MKALILAAGYATRLYPLTKDRPKALLPIGDKAIMDYLIEQIQTLPALDEVHIISNHRFITHFEDWARTAEAENRYPSLKLCVWDDGTTSDEDKLGAIGDMQFVIERAGLDDDLLVAAADNFFTFRLKEFYDDFMAHGCDTILAAKIDDIALLRRFAVAKLDDQRRVLALVEKPENPESDIGVYALYLYRQDTLPLIAQYLAEGHSPDAPGHLPEWLCTLHEVRAFLFSGEVIDIGTPESYREVLQRFGQ